MNDGDKIIKKLNMISHPEGGDFKESYRDKDISLIYRCDSSKREKFT